MPEMLPIGFANWIVASVWDWVISGPREDNRPTVLAGVGLFIRGSLDGFLVMGCRLLVAGITGCAG